MQGSFKLLENRLTVFTRLNAAAFITFELAEGGGTYLRVAFIISAWSYSINFTRLNVQACGYCGGAGSVRKGIAAAAHNVSTKYCIYSMKRLLFRR